MMIPNSSAKAIFGQAIDLDAGAARSAFLDQACVGDLDLRQEIDALLYAWEAAGDFLSQPAATMVDVFSPDAALDGPGTVIGRYRLLDQIGDGGMDRSLGQEPGCLPEIQGVGRASCLGLHRSPIRNNADDNPAFGSFRPDPDEREP
jgi:hypothetical protein